MWSDLHSGFYSLWKYLLSIYCVPNLMLVRLGSLLRHPKRWHKKRLELASTINSINRAFVQSTQHSGASNSLLVILTVWTCSPLPIFFPNPKQEVIFHYWHLPIALPLLGDPQEEILFISLPNFTVRTFEEVSGEGWQDLWGVILPGS